VSRITRTSRNQRGLTLIELMLAVTLGFLVSAVVLSLYINTGRSLAQNERYAWMQENARFALKALSEDLSMADFWGRVIPTDVVTSNVTPPVGDCGEDIDIYDANAAILVNNYHVGPAVTQFTPCADITTDRRANTDVLAIKRVEGSSTASTFIDAADVDGDANTTEILTLGASDLTDGDVYLRSTVNTGTFIDDASSSNPPGTGQADWRYMPRVYFIRDYYESAADGIPALCRLVISGIELTTTECIAEGVEDFHVQFGIDTDQDAIANFYTSTPSAGDLENTVSARLYLLARSIDADPHFTNDTQYVLGDATVAAANDGFYRRVYSTTVALRNSASRSLMQ
jgi:type IV pilus assembly protein PilW